MKYCSNKDINRMIHRLVRMGWVFRHGSKHGQLTPPHGKPKLIVSRSPSDNRALLNFRQDIRNAINT